jgi:glycosyltransferase involved in cell wall biosynthesis
MPADQWRSLQSCVERHPNVTLRRSTPDMRSIYRDTKILIMPSLVEETFGRVAVEAQASGIPVLTRDIGALAWTVGDGGIVIPSQAPHSEWEEALRRLLSDNAFYSILSKSAYQNARRSEFNRTGILDHFESILLSVA